MPQSALVVGDYKIIRNLESGSVELFDLARDLSETNDLAADLPDKAKEIDERLTDRLKHANAQMPWVNPNYDPDSPATQNRRYGPGRRRETVPPRLRRFE